MNQAFLAIVVKILGRAFTIPRRFVDLLWRVTERAPSSFLHSCRVRVIEYGCQSKSMQRISVLSLALLSTVAASSSGLAGPLSINPKPQRQAPPIASIYSAPPVQPAPQVRHAAPRGQHGGGFIEFLFGGGPNGGPRYEPPPANYRNYPGEPADHGPGAAIDPRFLKQEVAYDGREAAGTVVINTGDRHLYLVQGNGRALRYGIGVGRPGFTWSGVHHISQKREWPDWTPPDEMLRRRPDLPRHMVGGPDNPLGARAMYLGSTLYRIHGSNEPWTIGTQVSSGCIRMRNEDVIDLYSRVKVGTKVVVM
jgi:lipoprotein-anchoring transpeptidase ErfK/SrfK